jgi:CTP synthase
MKDKKYIIITGGVLSGIGKGVTTASLAFFFSSNYKVVPIKLDGYLNVDPGTMNPIEHGEVFVLDDGAEVDMDFGHYERFSNITAKHNQSQSMGKIYDYVRKKERKGDYLGQTVQLIPHVTNAILEKILNIANDNQGDIVLIEVGGTVGDIENELFIEAMRQLKSKVGKDNVVYMHLSYIPIPYGVKEQKTKPTQQSIQLLNQRGIWPDFILCRCSEYLTDNVKNKISMFCNVSKSCVVSLPDIKEIYELPNILLEQDFIREVFKKFNLEYQKNKKIENWNKLLNTKKDKNIKIGLAGKYTGLEDSYASIVESIRHCSYYLDTNIDIEWIETSNSIDENYIKSMDAIIVPGGFGNRGVTGKIEVIRIARENNIPFLGICYGLQLSVIEFLRNVCNVKNASSLELGCDLKDAVITILDEQKNVTNKGGTMRLGSYKANLIDSKIKELYKELDLYTQENNNFCVRERHRHRYEVNPNFIDIFEKKGLKVVGRSFERDLVEFIELDEKLHPYFVATQGHPELKSKLEKPAPLFKGLVQSAINKKYKEEVKKETIKIQK